ncbi:MAG TPA: serine hydrolase domain-containing protein [Solirubrobacterales bacterium]|jgi:D-alanyl-D-alanine carboxypeptidase|nr:serine hydrolase domain-containing protein [Solirubrobacterales bacterium]
MEVTMHAKFNPRVLLLTALVVVVGLFAGGCSAEDEIQAEANKEEASLLQPELDRLVAAGVPGAVLVVDDPQADPIVVSSGVADIESKRPIEADDRFRIGSLTKSYVAAVVLQLDEEGALSLDDSVEKWLPGLLPNGEEIDVRELLGHRTGLFEYEEDPRVLQPYLKGDYGYVWQPRQLIAIANDHKPTAEPGTKVVYSNTNYTVAGLLVEAATGKSLRSELEQRLFAPLGLDATSFVEDAQMEAPHSRGYLGGGKQLLDVTAISPSHYWAAGNIVSTAGEVARFNEALFDGELLSEDSMDELTTFAAEAPGLERGLGIARGETECGSWEGHDGSVPGYDAFARHTDSDRQIVLLMNTVTMGDQVGSPAAQKALGELAESAACR